MKKTSERLMELRKPYIKLILVLGLFSWMKDCHEADDATQQAIGPTETTEMCGVKPIPEKIPESEPCSLATSLHLPIFSKQTPYEK